jgi:hypothetical protein
MMGSPPLPPSILRRPLPVTMLKQSVSPGCLLWRHPNSLPTLLLVPQAIEIGRKQPPMQGSLLPLLDFVIVLQAQLPIRQGTAALPNCDPSCGQCANTVATHNAVIRDANCVHLPSSTTARFCVCMGLLPCLLIPLIINPAECTGDDNELATTASPVSNVTSSVIVNASMGPNPLRPELPMRETRWLCCQMEVTPAPPLNCPLAMVWLCCSVPTAVPPKPSYASRQDVTLMH